MLKHQRSQYVAILILVPLLVAVTLLFHRDREGLRLSTSLSEVARRIRTCELDTIIWYPIIRASNSKVGDEKKRLGGAAGLTSMPVAPNVTAECYPTSNDQGPGSVGKECCLNFQGLEIRDFKFNLYDTVMKVRRPVHKVGPEYVRDYEAAVSKMKELDKTNPSDPRSWGMQALIHCAYCDGVYRHQGFNDVPYEIHNSWLFYAFHRWYLYFFERIAGELIGKPDFALHYWAWDIPIGMTMPRIYQDQNSPLYDDTREKTRVNGTIDISFIRTKPKEDDDELIEDNLRQMNLQMVNVRSELFMGSKYKAGTPNREFDKGSGTIEKGAHNHLHSWIGGHMPRYSTAAFDPIFYALHGNIDRMWHVWESSMKQRSCNYTKDKDYLNASFVFYDEHGKPVRVYIKDCLDMDKLGYRYEELPLTWLDYGDREQATCETSSVSVVGLSLITLPQKLDSVVRTEVERPRKSRTKEEKEKEEEVIVIDVEVSYTNDSIIKFDTYINDECEHNSEDRTQVIATYAGSFSTLPRGHGGPSNKSKTNRVKLGLNRLIENLGVENDDTLKVTLVPRSGKDAIVITSIKIDYIGD